MSSLSQKQVVILLTVIAALLAGIIGVIVYQRANAVPGVSANAVDTGAPASTGDGSGATTGTGAGPGTAPAAVDPASAPKVAKGQTPEEFVKQYYTLCQQGDYAAAYKMLPPEKQAYYQSVEGFQSALEGYAISGFSVEPQQENGDQITVVGYQDTPQMKIGYTWTFVKGDDGGWVLVSRDMKQ